MQIRGCYAMCTMHKSFIGFLSFYTSCAALCTVYHGRVLFGCIENQILCRRLVLITYVATMCSRHYHEGFSAIINPKIQGINNLTDSLKIRIRATVAQPQTDILFLVAEHICQRNSLCCPNITWSIHTRHDWDTKKALLWARFRIKQYRLFY